VIGRCLALHRSLCSAEMRAFHHILERFFRKNFADEIERLNMVDEPLGEGVSSSFAGRLPYMSQMNGYDGDPSIALSSPSLSTVGNAIDPRDSPRPMVKDTLLNDYLRRNQTLLQRNLAHLARHGLNGHMSGGAAERSTITSDTRSDSPDTNVVQFVNVGYKDDLAVPKGSSRISRKLGSIVRRQRWD